MAVEGFAATGGNAQQRSEEVVFACFVEHLAGLCESCVGSDVDVADCARFIGFGCSLHLISPAAFSVVGAEDPGMLADGDLESVADGGCLESRDLFSA